MGAKLGLKVLLLISLLFCCFLIQSFLNCYLAKVVARRCNPRTLADKQGHSKECPTAQPSFAAQDILPVAIATLSLNIILWFNTTLNE